MKNTQYATWTADQLDISIVSVLQTLIRRQDIINYLLVCHQKQAQSQQCSIPGTNPFHNPQHTLIAVAGILYKRSLLILLRPHIYIREQL
ncbi:hypothetical protein AOXY_G10958 [Acipenser oxyrinchus oxyrinchus]|uniref:Uncharacterized protein n=1 Tax=Acipenser oxyrinchus oxyrinchus TaxID=40147 RepID=A0AAD8DG68_ACIOX|nr:hypothetical protein AOXY_G10958 [Acipenser oxyrinchus oxyrinchus]